MDRSKIVILGSTGSVGSQALDVADRGRIKVEGISGYSNISLLEEQIRKHSPDYCAVKDDAALRDIRVRCADLDVKFFAGEGAIGEMIQRSDSDIVLNSITGKAGLIPTVEALKCKKRLALANKESLVIAGETVTALAKERKVEIIPVDSEHSAIFQCIGNEPKDSIRRIILTASGGRYYGKKKTDLETVTPGEALMHPTWNMGARITIDSATLMNKGFEVIEAAWLFGVPLDKIDVVVQRESIIHSMVEYIDNAVIAQLAVPDMRLCIQYAVTYPERNAGVIEPLDFTKLSSLTFGIPDTDTFPCLELARVAFRRGGVSAAALNAADEIAVKAFLEGRISFNFIPEMIARTVDESPRIDHASLDDCLAADEWAREYASKLVGGNS
ncbi:MAG: 1-deoxy-D-xylulose-5-phosphate reductoisomerase [Clostridia bacterium]|nr:1-deoxy-D-xylulose-5-phosphate reductoisomerase [Clostridia bacterium]